jgi:pyruvate/2-oxoglutarate dehydrogenase complex dihydrolipoamide dehydrogenase (E3) component
VEYKNTGIIVNKYFQTTNKSIFAIGDAIDSQNSSTERSKYEASILASNLLHRTKIVANYTGFIRSIDTFPAVATVGLNDHDLLERDRKSRRSIVQFKDCIASKIAEQEHGFIKLVADSSDHIVGATIVAPNATLIAEELATAIRHRISATNLVDTPYSAFGYNQAIKTAARKFIR